MNMFGHGYMPQSLPNSLIFRIFASILVKQATLIDLFEAKLLT